MLGRKNNRGFRLLRERYPCCLGINAGNRDYNIKLESGLLDMEVLLDVFSDHLTVKEVYNAVCVVRIVW